MNKYYITFGQTHVHSVNGRTFDKDCLAEIEAETKEKAFYMAKDIFNNKFHQCLTKEQAEDAMKYFPRGIIKI